VWFGAFNGLKKFDSMQTTLQISFLWLIPIMSCERLAIGMITVDFALKKNELPISWVCRCRLCRLHFCPSSFFQVITYSAQHLHAFTKAEAVPPGKTANFLHSVKAGNKVYVSTAGHFAVSSCILGTRETYDCDRQGRGQRDDQTLTIVRIYGQVVPAV